MLVIDEFTKKIIDNVVKEDDILNENIASMCSLDRTLDIVLRMDKISRGSRRGGR